MKKRRRKYTEEFKEEAVKLILEQGYPISEAARNSKKARPLLGGKLYFPDFRLIIPEN